MNIRLNDMNTVSVIHPSVSGLLKIERYTRHATHVKLAAFL